LTAEKPIRDGALAGFGSISTNSDETPEIKLHVGVTRRADLVLPPPQHQASGIKNSKKGGGGGGGYL